MTRMLAFRLPLLATVVVFTGVRPATAQTVPAGFTNSLVATVGSPTDIAFLPDGRMLITTQSISATQGVLRVYCPSNALPGCSGVPAGGGLLTPPAITISPICSSSEQGILGVAVDPAFASNSSIFLFYTANTAGGCRNRVSRYVYNGAANTAGSELVLIDNMPSPNGNHNAGDLEFGKDGYLYVTIGEGGNNAVARQENVLAGKVLRITRDGGIPATNPFASPLAPFDGDRCNVTGSTTAGRRCQETFAWGFRNPFRFAFDPNAAGTRFFVNDVGQNAYEEIDEIVAGADYGWNCREGKHANPGGCAALPSMVDPIFEYGRGANTGVPIANCAAITGGAFVPNGLWPAAYNNQYLFADYTCGGVFQMSGSSPFPTAATTFGSSFGGVTNLRFGPYLSTQALYYTTYASGGQVRRITSTSPLPPTAVASSDIPGGPSAPLLVTFSGAGSTDPGGAALTYIWDFGDGGGAQPPTASVTIQHTYTALGTFIATLRVSNGTLTSDPATVVIQVGTPPPGTFYTVTPCRAVDTRGPAGPFGGPALATGATRSFTLTNRCGIPSGVKAVVVNVTVTPPNGTGDLRLFPTGGSATSSSINFSAGQTRANNATVKVNVTGQFSVTAVSGTNFLLDIVGYFQ